MKLYIRILIVAIACFFGSAASAAGKPAAVAGSHGRIDYNRFLEENKQYDIPTLMERAKSTRLQEHYDSAAAYYSMVSSMYADNLAPADVRSCAVAAANLGYIWLSWRMNAVEAYPWLAKARTLADRHDLKDVMAAVNSTLGEMYFDFNDYAKARRYFTDTFDDVLTLKSDRYAGMASLDFAVSTLLCGKSRQNDSILARAIEYRPADKNAPLVDLTPRVAAAMRAYASGNPAGAIEKLGDDTPDFEGIADPARYRILYSIVRAKLMSEAGRYAEAEEELTRASETAKERNYYNLMEKCYMLHADIAEQRTDLSRRDKYRTMAMEIRDSLYNISGFDAIKDLEIADSLGSLERNLQESRQKEARQRELTMMALGAGGVLFCLLLWLFISRRKLKSAYAEIYKRNLELSERQPVVTVGRESQKAARNPEAESDADSRELLGRILEFMNSSDLIYNPKFSVDTLAEAVGSKPKNVSQVINGLTDKNFNSLLAEYRVREACRLLNNPDTMKTMTVETVGESVGYRSRTNFSKVFKDVTGLTPSQFARQSRLNLS